MKKYNFKLFLRIAITVLASIAFGYLLSQQLYAASVLSALVVLWAIRRLFSFQKRNTKDLIRFIQAIQFSEFNISFKSFAKRGLSPELIPEMETAIAHFNQKLTKMEAEQNFYDTLLNQIDFGVFVVDNQENIKWINKSALDFFKRPYPQQIADLGKTSAALPQILRDLLPKETKIVAIGDEKAVQQFVVTAVYFISEGKQLKLISLKNIESILEESESEAWKKLVRVLTHEIMNSIAPIISLAETFASPDEENRKMLPQAMEIIHRRSKGLVDFVHNYQKLSRIPNPIMTTFTASDFMNDITKLLEASELKFSYIIHSPDILLKADRNQMEQVMINLIKNACETTENESEPKVTVEIGYNEHRQPTIKVTDNGEGILPEAMENIFTPFFTTKTNGSGIGLSICRQIVSAHGGTISVRSEVEKGSCFRVVL